MGSGSSWQSFATRCRRGLCGPVSIPSDDHAALWRPLVAIEVPARERQKLPLRIGCFLHTLQLFGCARDESTLLIVRQPRNGARDGDPVRRLVPVRAATSEPKIVDDLLPAISPKQARPIGCL